MRFKLSDDEIIDVCKSSGSSIAMRVAINYLFLNNKDLIKQHSAEFLTFHETVVSYLYYSGQTIGKECFRDGEMQLNDFPILKKYFQQNGLNFYEHVDLQSLNSTIKSNVSLSAEIVKNLPDARVLDHTFTESYLCKKKNTGKIKVVGITKIKNEGFLPALAIEQWLKFCDHIIISDASEPSFSKMSLKFSDQVTVIEQIKPFKENLVYGQLYAEARKKNATHILHFDVDEILEPSITFADFFERISRLEPGESLAVPWPQLFTDGESIYEFDYSDAFESISFHRLLPQYKDLVFCDDGYSNHASLSLHCPTIPEGYPSKRFFAEFKLFHLEGLNLRRLIHKYNNYYFYDFALNHDVELVLKRYLPRYLLINELLKPNNFLKPIANSSEDLIKGFLPAFKHLKNQNTSNENPESPEIFNNFQINI